jgi:hypothetical protein
MLRWVNRSIDAMTETDTQEDLTEVEIFDYARRLFEARGGKAIAEAAQKAGALEQQGDAEQARTWRQIEAALRSMRGPIAS